MNKKEHSHLFLIVIILIAACIETDIYLPAFPDMMQFFNTSEDVIQSLLTWNFLGICISCPFYGPLSDSFGRRKPLLVALFIFGMGSAITLFSQDFDSMLIGRVLQGLGSGGCFTLGTAILFDVFNQEKALQAINKINTAIPMIMALAPLAGGYLNSSFGFRSNFIAIAVFVGLSFFICFFSFDETLKEDARIKFSSKEIIKDFKRAFMSEPFWLTTIFISLVFGIYMAFLSLSSVLFVLELGVQKIYFPLFQTAILSSWLLASISYNTVSKNLGKNFKHVSLFIVFLGLFLFCLLSFIFNKNPYVMTFTMMIESVGFNFCMTLYFNECMQWLADIKGIAASLLTSARLLLAAIVVGISSSIYDKTVINFVILAFIITIIVLICILRYEKKYAYKLPQ